MYSDTKKYKVLFLDIDGVLNDEEMYELDPSKYNPAYPIDRRKPHLINYIVNQTGCKIVITSSWRIDGKDKLNKEFAPYGLPEIFDTTPYLWGKEPDEHLSRGNEIQTWLDNHKEEVLNYAILDDESDFLETQLKHHVQTDTYTGLTSEDSDRIIEILNEIQ